MTTTADRPRLLVAHPSAELYGSDRVLRESVGALLEAGWDVTVVLAGDGPLRQQLEDDGASVLVQPVPVLRKSLLSPVGVLRFAGENLAAAPRLLRLLRATRPDAVYVSTVTVPLWLLLARLLRRPVVCHVHEAEEQVPRPVRLALALPLLLARVVLANSAFSRELLVRDLPLLRRRTAVLYNGVPGPDRWTPPRPTLADPVRLVLVGRISPRKGTDVAVTALARLRSRGVDAELTLVGGAFTGYEWFVDEVRELARAEGVEERVHWAGVLPDVWEPLAAADVALVPSRVEPFGNAAVEALLAGRPLVVGDTQGLREIVEPGVDGERAAAGDPDALADAVQRVLADWPAAVSRAERARRRAAQRFGPDQYRRELLSWVTRVAGQASTTAVRI